MEGNSESLEGVHSLLRCRGKHDGLLWSVSLHKQRKEFGMKVGQRVCLISWLFVLECQEVSVVLFHSAGIDSR